MTRRTKHHRIALCLTAVAMTSRIVSPIGFGFYNYAANPALRSFMYQLCPQQFLGSPQTVREFEFHYTILASLDFVWPCTTVCCYTKRLYNFVNFVFLQHTTMRNSSG